MKKLAIIVFTVLFALCILPGVSLASTTTIDLDTITDGTTGAGYSFSGGVLTLSGNGPFTITTNGNTIMNRSIIVSSGVTADITLNDTKIDVSSASDVCAFDMTGATVNLTLTGTNILKSGNNRAGLEVPSGAALTVTAQSTGTLAATGGTASAGIGGGRQADCGTVTVYGGEITAMGTHASGEYTYGGGAGIGGGGSGGYSGNGGNGGTVVIDGGTVNATGGACAAGIGGGCALDSGGNAGSITIKSGTVTATGTLAAAGIGGGWRGSGGAITIEGGDVTANGSGGEHPIFGESGGAGIGGGSSAADAGDIVITGGTVRANGGGNAPGIGQGYHFSGTGSGSVRIEDGDITATGGIAGAGIGNGLDGGNISVTISGGTVNATGGLGGAGIGGGLQGADVDITITGGDITATGHGGEHPTRGETFGAGIGAGRGSSTTVISGGIIEATGGNYGGAGIGGESGSIEITGGTVTATGGHYAGYGDPCGGAGIGGTAHNGFNGTVTLSGGTIYATRGEDAQNDIGYGKSSSGMTLNISGSAAVLMRNDSCIAPVTSHTHYSFTEDTDKAYGISVPGEWAPTFGAYLKLYTLSYDANGGSGTAPAVSDQAAGASVSVDGGGSLSLTYYHFDGWNTIENGSGTDYAAGAAFTFGADTTLYAQWEANTYTVAYDANGGAGTTAASMHTCDVAQALTANGFTREHYAFAGWATSATGDVVYADKQSVMNLTAVNGGTVTLYAQWTELTLSSSISSGKIYTGGRIVLTPSVDGGTWDWDHDFFTATFNSPATFTALKAGTSTITYTVEGVTTSYEVTIEENELPATGQSMTWVWVLIDAAVMALAAGVALLRRVRA